MRTLCADTDNWTCVHAFAVRATVRRDRGPIAPCRLAKVSSCPVFCHCLCVGMHQRPQTPPNATIALQTQWMYGLLDSPRFRAYDMWSTRGRFSVRRCGCASSASDCLALISSLHAPTVHLTQTSLSHFAPRDPQVGQKELRCTLC